jgi:large subunit ribosomal protein L20
MARVKSIAQRRHRKIRAKARGFQAARRKRVKSAKEALLHAGQYAYHGRKLRKRDIRKLWITRLGIAAKENDLSYSKLMAGLKKAKIELDRKILSEIAVSDPATFKEIISSIK